jgi:hypothetical protein
MLLDAEYDEVSSKGNPQDEEHISCAVSRFERKGKNAS